MKSARRLTLSVLGGSILSAAAFGQVPDLLNAFDAGGRAMGAGGSFYGTSADTLSAFYNPAGLGYISRPTFGLVYRNFPASRTLVSGNFDDPVRKTSGSRGNSGISHLGIAIPRAGGTLALTYTVGGFVDDTRHGENLTSGVLTVTGFREHVQASSDYITLGFGKTSPAGNVSYGIGLQYLLAHILDRVAGNLVDSGGNTVGSLASNVDGTPHGVSVIAGVQITPKDHPNSSFGFSYRSESKLSGSAQASSLYNRVPARFLADVAFRRDNLRGGQDYLIYAAQLQYFFNGARTALFDRKAQAVGGLGLEYNHRTGSAVMPFRIGYNIVPSGGNGYASRSALTLGIGYRPDNNRYTFDLNLAAPDQGGWDMAFGLNYHFGS